MVAHKMISTQFVCVPSRTSTSPKMGHFCTALQFPITFLKKSEKLQEAIFSKWGANAKNQAYLKEKEPKIDDFGLKVAEREGFEPSCA